MNRPARRLWGLVAIGAATAVGVTTHEPGFIVITFLGTLLLPRVLGFHGPGMWRGGCGGWRSGRSRLDDRMTEWHRQAHTDAPSTPGGTAAAQV